MQNAAVLPTSQSAPMSGNRAGRTIGLHLVGLSLAILFPAAVAFRNSAVPFLDQSSSAELFKSAIFIFGMFVTPWFVAASLNRERPLLLLYCAPNIAVALLWFAGLR